MLLFNYSAMNCFLPHFLFPRTAQIKNGKSFCELSLIISITYIKPSVGTHAIGISKLIPTIGMFVFVSEKLEISRERFYNSYTCKINLRFNCFETHFYKNSFKAHL